MEPNETSIFDDLQNERPLEYATTGQRFANFIIDMIIVRIFLLIVFVVIGLLVPSFISYFQSDDFSVKLVDILVTAASMTVIYTFIEGASKGKSLGKLITGTRAVKEDGSPITWNDAFVRSICRFVPFETLSGFSGYPWHDKWSKTYVIKERKTI
jgi:uncharacterized RDD family membrane protein YckC